MGNSSVSTASALVAEPVLFVTTAEYFALWSAASAAVMVSVADVAPEMGAPLRRHWWLNGAAPVAVTLKVAGCNSVTVVLAGCAVIAGACNGAGAGTGAGAGMGAGACTGAGAGTGAGVGTGAGAGACPETGVDVDPDVDVDAVLVSTAADSMAPPHDAKSVDKSTAQAAATRTLGAVLFLDVLWDRLLRVTGILRILMLGCALMVDQTAQTVKLNMKQSKHFIFGYKIGEAFSRITAYCAAQILLN